MQKKVLLLQRLDEIGKSLERMGDVLCLLALGSVGVETERIDDYSDLDFFVIVTPGHKERFIDHLDWLSDIQPLAYYFKNYKYGYKILFEDGIYGEFAVFEEWELKEAGYSEGRIIWKKPSYANEAIAKPTSSFPVFKSEAIDFVMNEALTNLYVGLGRYARGEKLSAAKFVEGYAVDGLISVMHLLEREVDYYPDSFGNERRFEARFPKFAQRLGGMLKGYDKVPESAIHILNYMEEVFPVNTRLSIEIRQLAERCVQGLG